MDSVFLVCNWKMVDCDMKVQTHEVNIKADL